MPPDIRLDMAIIRAHSDSLKQAKIAMLPWNIHSDHDVPVAGGVG